MGLFTCEVLLQFFWRKFGLTDPKFELNSTCGHVKPRTCRDD